MAIDWSLYESDIKRWYLDERKSANDVIQLLLQTHNVEVKCRQFKDRFGGLKKISANEWQALIPEIHKREDQGLGYVIYLWGKAIRQETVARSIRRYSKSTGAGNQRSSPVVIGLNTVGQHRIEIRYPSQSGAPSQWGTPSQSESTSQSGTPSQSGSQFPCDEGTTGLPSRHEGEGTSRFGNDEPNIDQGPSMTDMNVALNTQTTPGTGIYPSSYMSFGNFDQHPFGVSGTLALENSNQMPMGNSGTMLPGSQHQPFSPLPSPFALPLLGYPFTSFWDTLEISSITLMGGEVLELAVKIGIFVPDHDQSERLQKLNLTTAQAETLGPIIQGQAAEYRLASPNLLDLADNNSLDQALSVIVYMISNNFISPVENYHMISWILERGHVSKLFAFSQRPDVRHLAFGSAFLGAICRMATETEITLSSFGLFQAFVSSNEFLGFVKSQRLDLSGPLGIELFRLAITANSMRLGTFLASHSVNLSSNLSLQCDPCQKTLLAHAIEWRRDSMLDSIVRLGADVNQNFPGGPALKLAVKTRNHVAIDFLLNEGARIGDGSESQRRDFLEFAYAISPETYMLLREKLEPSSEPDCWELIDAARKGNRELSNILLAHGIVSPKVLENAMCQAIRSRNLAAVRTFLQRGVSAEAGIVAFRNYLGSFSRQQHLALVLVDFGATSLADTLYLLIKAGVEVDNETAMSVRLFIDQNPKSLYCSPLLCVLLQVDYNEAWVHQYLLTFSAEEGSIFECDVCIDSGIPINGYGCGGKSCLTTAAGEGCLALVQHLISREANPRLPPSSDAPNGETALYAAVYRNHWDVTSYLIDSGADARAEATTAGITLLEGAVLEPDDTRFRSRTMELSPHFRKLLSVGAPVNRPNGSESFLLHALLHRRQLGCLKLALDAGARVEDKFLGITPIQLAVLDKNLDAIRCLLEYGASINMSAGSVDDHPPAPKMSSPASIRVHRFCAPLRDAIFQRIFHSGFHMGVSANKQAYFPHTPLQLASSCHDPDPRIVELLLRHKADVNAPAAAWYGRTALQGAASCVTLNMDIVELLLGWEADVKAPPAQVGGVTALQAAAIRGNIQLVDLLHKRGADINAPGAPVEGRTALEGAAEHGRMEMLRFLLSNYAPTDLVTGCSKAIALAEKELHLGIAKFLREEQQKFDECCGRFWPLCLDLHSP
ncbi:hypothetical protein MRS44_014783 [Fusarium solani]|uniref:uncharacterized protein n=1 Tax=Fusarium solani TaxID=169388 RepID=UPI0032C49822|nr:hypothetical protein MRS44_014783 [Fusarium solani]